MKFKKRGAVEVQFNWIFVLIAGSVILLFFGSIIMKQRSASEQRLSASLLSDLESIMAGSIVTEEALNFISVPKKDINFKDCSFYYIGKKDEADVKLKKDIKEKIIFAPDVIRGTKLTIWTLPWDIPYKVTNFLYLTSPQVRYVFYGDMGLVEDLLPEGTITIDEEDYTTMFIDDASSTTLSDLNNYKVKVVVLDDKDPITGIDITALSDMEDDDVRAIKITNYPDGMWVWADFNFYKKERNRFKSVGSSFYHGKAGLIAAIFAEDKDMFECAMQNAFQRLGVVTDVYTARTTALQSGAPPSCDYTAQSGYLGSIKSASDTFNRANVIAIKTAGNNLESQDKNCPLVY